MSAKYWNRLDFERALWQQGLLHVAGVDEAGCGPLAGPVVAAAVVFPCGWLESGLYPKLRGLNDSKQLTREQREKYFASLAELGPSPIHRRSFVPCRPVELEDLL